MTSRRTSSVPKEDVVFPRMLYCDSRCSQKLPGLSPALLGPLLCNTTHHLGDRERVILRQRVRASVGAVTAVWNTCVFLTETKVVADGSQMTRPAFAAAFKCISKIYFSYWEPPGVSERRRSVNLEASISGENQTLGVHSGRPSELLGPLMTCMGAP
jgi:hypothetical protein